MKMTTSPQTPNPSTMNMCTPTMNNGQPWNSLLSCCTIFSHLQSIEPLLKDGYRVKITRSTESKIYFSIHAIGSTKYAYYTTIKAKDVTCDTQLRHLLGAIWQELNARKLVTHNS